VSLVDHETGRVTKYPLGVRGLQVAAAGDLVVATSATENAVIALDATSGSVIARTTLPTPRLAAVSGSDIWIDTGDGLVRMSRDLSVKAKYPSLGAGLGSEVSLKDFRKDIVLELYNETGQIVLAYKIYRCWISEYQVLPELDANANAVAIEFITLENEGWERDHSIKEPVEPSFKKS